MTEHKPHSGPREIEVALEAGGDAARAVAQFYEAKIRGLEEQLEAERLRADQNAHLSEVKHERMRELEEQLEAAERLLLAHRQEYVDVYLELSTRDHMNEDEEDARRSLAAFETQAFYPASGSES